MGLRRAHHILSLLVPTGLAGWSAASHVVALDNARAAATACSRARVEREEVARYLAVRAVATTVAPDGAATVRSATH